MSRADRPPISDRARMMAEMLNQGLTQRAIAAKFNITPARVSQIIGSAAIRLRLWETGGGGDVWRDTFGRDMRRCAIFLTETSDAQK